MEGRRRCVKCHSIGWLYPSISKEWHSKNTKTVYEYFAKSGKKVWWKCLKCKNEWESTIASRTSSGTGCPKCKLVVLKDGTKWDSLTEAYQYLIYKKEGYGFFHHKRYGKGLGNSIYDFYFPKTNKYVEVTGYRKGSVNYFQYLRKIVKKRRYVTKVLKANFEFVQLKLSIKQKNFVKQHEEIA